MKIITEEFIAEMLNSTRQDELFGFGKAKGAGRERGVKAARKLGWKPKTKPEPRKGEHPSRQGLRRSIMKRGQAERPGSAERAGQKRTFPSSTTKPKKTREPGLVFPGFGGSRKLAAGTEHEGPSLKEQINYLYSLDEGKFGDFVSKHKKKLAGAAAGLAIAGGVALKSGKADKPTKEPTTATKTLKSMGSGGVAQGSHIGVRRGASSIK